MFVLVYSYDYAGADVQGYTESEIIAAQWCAHDSDAEALEFSAPFEITEGN